jgi:hypothetical protein
MEISSPLYEEVFIQNRRYGKVWVIIFNDINHSKGRHSSESRNPGKHWIPGQVRNDKIDRTYVAMYRIILSEGIAFYFWL